MGGFITGGLQGFLSQWSVKSNPPPDAPNTQAGPWRPPAWGQQPRLTMMTVTMPADTTSAQGTGKAATPTNFFFDAVFREDHDTELVATQHPVQDGAAICDHAYLKPSRVTLEIGMSDAMDSFVSGQYSDNKSKSISAYQKFREIQKLCVPIQLTTRLFSYSNMLIATIRTTDDRSTRFALKAFITFQQIIPAVISTKTVSVPSSARPQDTDESNFSKKVTQDVPQATREALMAPEPRPASYETSTTGPLNVNSPGYTVPGAGKWSSKPLGGGGGSAF